MKNILFSDVQFDAFFQKALNEYLIKYNPDHWWQMEKKLGNIDDLEKASFLLKKNPGLKLDAERCGV